MQQDKDFKGDMMFIHCPEKGKIFDECETCLFKKRCKTYQRNVTRERIKAVRRDKGGN